MLRKRDGSIYYFSESLAVWKFDDGSQNWLQVPFQVSTEYKLPSVIEGLEFEESLEVNGTHYIGRLVFFEYKGGQAQVLDIPEDQELWGTAGHMQTKKMMVPYESQARVGKY